MKKALAAFLALLLLSGLCACGKAQPKADGPVRVMVLNGTTGFGMAKLICDSAPEDYSFSVETDASAITAALVNGSCDIAALPTNAAAALYNKTDGGVLCIALNTLGVLYLVTDGTEEITALSDLEGRRVYVPAQNPTLIFSALCDRAGIAVTVDNSYAQPADLRTALAAGEVSIAVLPEPMATVACTANETLTVALDLTAEWDARFPSGTLVQGCAVVRKEFADAAPEKVQAFLNAYENSVAFAQDHPAEAAKCIADAGVLSSAVIAETALPRCNLCFRTGAEMQTALSGFLEIMYGADPASVGGAIPGDDFYFTQK